MKRKRLSPVSKKQAVRNAEAKPLRDALRVEVGRCEVCGYTDRYLPFVHVRFSLHVHEIARGANRSKALDQRYALLVVCWPCHRELDSAREWPEARQLAVLRASRPQDFDLAAYNELVCKAPTHITEEEVNSYA